MKEIFIKKQVGITLVALVVTMVVLLILAGITIMYTMGENSILNKAQDAKNKTEEAIDNEQEYMSQVDNMMNEYTNGTGNGGTNTPAESENPWAKVDRIAKAIANDENITNNSTQATGITEKGEVYDIKVGDILEVEYEGENKRVRVIGLKHDDLVNSGVYGGNHTKASITFDFIEFMTGSTWQQMNTSNTNSGGWANTTMRTFLNGAAGKEKLSNEAYIKQVKKKYIRIYNNASSVAVCNDYLWLLASSEIVNSGYKNGAYGYTITSEGLQYQYYKTMNPTWDAANIGLVRKPTELGTALGWWLRSPRYNLNVSFCTVHAEGYVNFSDNASTSRGIVPGFCI